MHCIQCIVRVGQQHARLWLVVGVGSTCSSSSTLMDGGGGRGPGLTGTDRPPLLLPQPYYGPGAVSISTCVWVCVCTYIRVCVCVSAQLGWLWAWVSLVAAVRQSDTRCLLVVEAVSTSYKHGLQELRCCQHGQVQYLSMTHLLHLDSYVKLVYFTQNVCKISHAKQSV